MHVSEWIAEREGKNTMRCGGKERECLKKLTLLRKVALEENRSSPFRERNL